MSDHPNLLDGVLSLGWWIAWALVGTEWLARRSPAGRPTQGEILASILLGAVWPVTLAYAAVVGWYGWRVRRINASRKADR